MSNRANRILQAWLTTPTSGVVELAKDWRARQSPPIKFSGGLELNALTRLPKRSYGEQSGYYVTQAGKLVFQLASAAHPKPFSRRTPVYVAGDFNGWGEAIGNPHWCLSESTIEDETVLTWTGEAEAFLKHPPLAFKFVTEAGHWFDVPSDAPNVSEQGSDTRNRIIDADRTGMHLFAFELTAPIDLTQPWRVHWVGGEGDNSVPLRPGSFFHQLKTDLTLGASVAAESTTFRLFAPRARQIELVLAPSETDGETQRLALERCASDPMVWEVTLEGNLHGWSYSYRVHGPRDEFGSFDPEQPVLDPYARAALSRAGPGLVIDAGQWRRPPDGFKTPAWQDLVICEAHVRDLVAMAPLALDDAERRTFAGLTKWVDSPGFYLAQLGVNCVELQPIQEFDNESPEEYHWGYMTNNYFAPESSYARDPATGSGITELQQLVSAFHRRGIAVVLDVVYNHVGVPGHLMFIDKLYYFNVTKDGDLLNWSGCGNDLRADAAMAKQLIIDSCTHLIETYGVDGFRFDLAELLGADVLKDIEFALKRVKADVILIAEPWSFRGHIAGALSDTGWASWNDGYRRFLKDYIKGHSSREAFEYYLKGSPWHFAKWPAQTINYVESHDDRTWIDEITENVDGSGHLATANDRRRTHLVAAVLFSSIGIPMISAGQDFLRSKHAINNTYQRGDLNALDYRRLERFSGTHAYFAEWIAFRKSPLGGLMRHYSRASEGFFHFWWAEDGIAAAVLYNADRSQGNTQLLFAINPTMHDTSIAIPEALAAQSWIRIADHERFMHSNVSSWGGPIEADLWLPALGCGLWRTDA